MSPQTKLAPYTCMHSGDFDFESSSQSWCNYSIEFMGNTDNDLHGLTYISIVLSKGIEIK